MLFRSKIKLWSSFVKLEGHFEHSVLWSARDVRCHQELSLFETRTHEIKSTIPISEEPNLKHPDNSPEETGP